MNFVELEAWTDFSFGRLIIWITIFQMRVQSRSIPNFYLKKENDFKDSTKKLI